MPDLCTFCELFYAVVSRSKEECGSASHVQVPIETGPGGFLASVVTDESGCGSLDTPWLLRTAPGQTIRLRLLDFESASRSASAAAAGGGDVGEGIQQSPRICQVFIACHNFFTIHCV